MSSSNCCFLTCIQVSQEAGQSLLLMYSAFVLYMLCVFSTYECSFTQLCLSLCKPMDCSPPGSFVHGIFPSENTGVGCCFLLQGIFPTQGSNPCLLHWQVNTLPLSHLGSPIYAIYTYKMTKSEDILPQCKCVHMCVFFTKLSMFRVKGGWKVSESEKWDWF